MEAASAGARGEDAENRGPIRSRAPLLELGSPGTHISETDPASNPDKKRWSRRHALRGRTRRQGVYCDWGAFFCGSVLRFPTIASCRSWWVNGAMLSEALSNGGPELPLGETQRVWRRTRRPPSPAQSLQSACPRVPQMGGKTG